MSVLDVHVCEHIIFFAGKSDRIKTLQSDQWPCSISDDHITRSQFINACSDVV